MVGLATEERVGRYLKPAGWGPINIGVALMKFEETHGEAKVESMLRFIDWAEANDHEYMVAPTIGHDLRGCEDATMCPRTSSY